MKQRLTLTLNISVTGPFIFPSMVPGSLHEDLHPSKDAKDQPLIPQDQLRGVFRHALKEMANNGGVFDEDQINALFGRAGNDVFIEGDSILKQDGKGLIDTYRGLVFFCDAKAPKQVEPPTFAARVAIDETTGAAKPGGQFMVDLVAPYGKTVEFVGSVVLIVESAEADDWAQAFRAAATWISSLGGMKSSGYGRAVVQVEVQDRKELSVGVDDQSPLPGIKTYEVSMDRPFLVHSDRVAGNVYLGAETIPGGVIKGALARKLKLADYPVETCENFTKLRISHARRTDAAPVLPLSVYSYLEAAGDRFKPRFADASQGVKTYSDVGSIQFQPDWKEEVLSAAYEAFGWEREQAAKRDVRVHVELDDQGLAKDEKIYEASAVVPEGLSWEVTVDYSNCGQQHARLFAAYLEDGLFGVGQTRASLGFEPATTTPTQEAHTHDQALVLLTDACIGDAKALTAQDLYTAYWRDQHGLHLKTFFAQQDIGGGYLGYRFYGGPGYRPFLVTKAGAVFVFHGQDVKAKLLALVKTGLQPLEDWQSCPYQVENGYGRVGLLPKLRESGHV